MASPFEGNESGVRRSVPLAPFTSFRIGGPAEFLVEPRTVDELSGLVRRCVGSGVPIHVLGGGSNILVSDGGVPGAVFHLTRMHAISREGGKVTCGAGATLPRLLHLTEEWGLSGLESLAGIPGTVGGAVAMNAGGKHGTISSALHSVVTLDREGRVRERGVSDLGLMYRHADLFGEVVVEATFSLLPMDVFDLIDRRLAILDEKRRTQPLTAYSAGCVFKNPGNRGAAGMLIDWAGLKGRRVGHAVVSERHANFIINEGGATAQDVTALIGEVRERVKKQFGVELELEIEFWN